MSTPVPITGPDLWVVPDQPDRVVRFNAEQWEILMIGVAFYVKSTAANAVRHPETAGWARQVREVLDYLDRLEQGIEEGQG